MVFNVAIGLGLLLVSLLMLREIVQFRRMREVHRLRRLTLRLMMAAMLLFQLLSILIGVRVFGLAEPDGVPNLWIAFWGCIGLLTGGILMLAIADFRLVGEDTLRNSAEHLDEIARTIAEHQANKSKD